MNKPVAKAALFEGSAQFRGEVVEQLETVGQEVGAAFNAGLTADGSEAFLEFSGRGDDEPILRIVVAFNDPRSGRDGWSDWLELKLEHAGEVSRLVTLAWHDRPLKHTSGLNTPVDYSEGRYGSGNVLNRLRRDIRNALGRNFPAAGRALVTRRATEVVDAEFEPVLPSSIAPHPAENLRIPETRMLCDALGMLPEGIAADAQNIFAQFMAASAQGGPLKPDDIAAFVQEGMAELLAFQEAHLEGRSPVTGLGVGLKGMALIGALITAIGAETMTGVFAFGPIIGHSIEALPLAGVGSLLLGGGLMPLARPGWERRIVFGAAVAWALAVSSLSARNPQLAEPAQGFFQMNEATMKARERAATAKLKLAAANERLANARSDKAKAGDAYLVARKNRPLVLNQTEAQLKDAEREQQVASAAWVDADSARAQAMKTDPSRTHAEAVIFVLTSVLNVMGPFFIGKFLERAEAVHANALGTARERRRLKKRTHSLRKSRKTQEAKARVLLAAMRGHYAAALRSTGRCSEAEIERMTTAAFGDTQTIVSKAVEGFRDGIRQHRLPKLWDSAP